MPSTNAHAATRSGRATGTIGLYVGGACCAPARGALEGPFGHVPLFPALTGLADGLALKELRYAG